MSRPQRLPDPQCPPSDRPREGPNLFSITQPSLDGREPDCSNGQAVPSCTRPHLPTFPPPACRSASALTPASPAGSLVQLSWIPAQRELLAASSNPRLPVSQTLGVRRVGFSEKQTPRWSLALGSHIQGRERKERGVGRGRSPAGIQTKSLGHQQKSLQVPPLQPSRTGCGCPREGVALARGLSAVKADPAGVGLRPR